MEEPDQNSEKEELRKMVFEHHAQSAERAARNLKKTPMGLKILFGFVSLLWILGFIVGPGFAFLVGRIKTLITREERPLREALKKIANEMGGEFIKGESKIRVLVGGWPIFISIYITHKGRRGPKVIAIQMSAPYVKKDNFSFFITGSGIKGNSESKVQDLLANSRIRHLIHTHISSIGRFGIAHNALQLVAYMGYVDVMQLRSLIELFAETLTQLCRIGSIYEGIPRKHSS